MSECLQLFLIFEDYDPVLEETTLKVIDKLRSISEDVYYDEDILSAKKNIFLNRRNEKASIADNLAIELALLKRERINPEELTKYYFNSPVGTLKKSLMLLEGVKGLDEISEEDFAVAYIASEIVARELLYQGQELFVIKHYTGDEL